MVTIRLPRGKKIPQQPLLIAVFLLLGIVLAVVAWQVGYGFTDKLAPDNRASQPNRANPQERTRDLVRPLAPTYPVQIPEPAQNPPSSSPSTTSSQKDYTPGNVVEVPDGTLPTVNVDDGPAATPAPPPPPKPTIPRKEITWKKVDIGPSRPFTWIRVDPNDPTGNTLHFGKAMGGYAEIWESKDRGDNWQPIGILDVIYQRDENKPNVLKIASVTGVWDKLPENRNKSKGSAVGGGVNGWTDWHVRFQKEVNLGALNLIRDGNTLFVPAMGGYSNSPSYHFLISLDLGDTWTEISHPPLEHEMPVTDVIAVVTDNDSVRIFLGTDKQELWQTTIPLAELQRASTE